MTATMKTKRILLAVAFGLIALGASERMTLSGAHGIVSSAEARVGRPLTPVSAAGVARRTVRRCAAGVYYC